MSDHSTAACLPRRLGAFGLLNQVLVLAATAVGLLGCEGGVSKDDLKRYALSNKFSENSTEQANQTEEKKAAATVARTPDADRPRERAVVAAKAPPARIAEEAPAIAERPNDAEPPKRTIKTLEPIPADLTPMGRYARSVENLDRIAKAFRSYYERTGALPKQGFPKVSWRVAILPDLGYPELYARYDQDQDWFSEANRGLLAEIPPEYQSPERRDSKTNYLVVTGRDTVYSRPGGGARDPGDSENLIALVEVDDDQAKPWLAPEDHEVDPRHQRGVLKGLGGLRGEEFLAMTGDMRLLAMPGRIGVSKRLKPNFVDEESAGDPAKIGRDVSEIRYAAFSESGSGSRVASANGRAGSLGSGRAEPGSAGSRPAAPLLSGGFVGECWRAAEVAAVLGHHDEAWLWARGATAAGLDSSAWESDFRWYPALQRPSLGLQVVVASPGQPNAASGTRTGSGTRESVAAKGALFRRQAGEVGRGLLREIDELTGGSAPGPLQASRQTARPNQQSTALSFSTLDYVLDAPNAKQAAAKARTAGADVLVYFEFSTAPGGRGEQLEVTLYDLFRGKRLLKTDRVLVRSLLPAAQEKAREGGKRVRWELKDYFEDNLTPQAWPVQMTARLAQRRLETLGSRGGRAMPLVSLTEMRHYRQQGLIDDAELLEAAEGVVGKSDALALVLGDQTKQRRVLREWLPSDDPAEYVERGERKRVAAREDG